MKLYSVYDVMGRQLSAAMRYKKACIVKRYIKSMSDCGGLQAIVATPPFKIKEFKC